MRHSSLTPVTAFSTLLLLLLLPSSSPSDFEASIHTISSSSYIKSLCWWGVVTFNGASNNCEEGPLQQSATPQTYTPEISIGGSSVSNNAQSYYKKLVNANTIPPETNDGNSNQKLVFTNLPAGVQHETTFSIYVALVDANNNLVSEHDACNVKLEVASAHARADENNDQQLTDPWLMFDLDLAGADTAVPMDFGIAGFPSLKFNVHTINVYLRAYCLEDLSLTVTSTDYIVVAATASVEQQIAEAATAQMPSGFGWTSSHNQVRNEYNVDANVLTNTDSIGSMQCTADSVNCHDNWQGDFAVIEKFDGTGCAKTAKLYEEYKKIDTCRVIRDGGFVGSEMTSLESIIQLKTVSFHNNTDCSGGGGAIESSVIDTIGSCVDGVSGSESYRAKRISNSPDKDENACETGTQVRVREWIGRSSKFCWLKENDHEQPTIRNYVMDSCYRVPGKNESFSFSGCYDQRRGLLNEFATIDCSGVSSQREWGDECFVGGYLDHWGVGSSGALYDMSTECGVTC